ncbi:MAG: hypothetical protein MJ107_08755 [Lachnospiraceae bacterium]|nr:hypothetical protein [Lachnospiraceae bacterium]
MKKKVISLILVATMAVAVLSGCGKSGNASDDGKNGKTDNGEKYVYIPSEKQIESPKNSYVSGEIVYRDGRIHYILQKNNDEGELIETCYISNNPDGTDEKSVSLKGLEDDGYPTEFFLNDDNTVSLVISSYDDKMNTNSYYAVDFDGNGEVSKTVSFQSVLDELNDEFPYINRFEHTKDGKYVICSDSMVFLTDETGKIEKKVSVNGFVNCMFTDDDGNTYAYGYFNQGEASLVKLDFDKGSVGDKMENVPESVNSFCKAGGSKYYTLSESSLGLYDISTQTFEPILKWLESDLDTPWSATFWEDGEGKISYASPYWGEGESENGGIKIVTLTKTLDTGNRQEIIVGAFYANDDLKSSVKEFNRSNTEYKVIIKSYEEEYGWEQAGDKLLNDIAQGGILDIVCLENTSGLDPEQTFVDLNPYIDKEPDINRADFFENALKAQETNGKLYSFSPSFQLFTLGGNSKYVGDGDSWTTDDFKKINSSFDGLAFGRQFSGATLVYYLTMFNPGVFDIEEAKCNFMSPDFLDILEVAKKYPVEEDFDSEYDEFKELMDEKAILVPLYIYEFDSMQVYDKAMNENMNIIGFPSETGSNHFFMFSGGYAILKNSANVDGSWQFLKKFFMPMEPTHTNLDGFFVNKESFEKYISMQKDHGYGGSWSSGGVSIEIEGVRDEDIEAVRKLVEIAKKPGAYDDSIYQILSEELEPFLKGNKSAEDVANVLQSRVSIFLAESN